MKLKPTVEICSRTKYESVHWFSASKRTWARYTYIPILVFTAISLEQRVRSTQTVKRLLFLMEQQQQQHLMQLPRRRHWLKSSVFASCFAVPIVTPTTPFLVFISFALLTTWCLSEVETADSRDLLLNEI